MSNYLAIATATETVAQIVREAVYASPTLSGASVTTLRPERVAKDAGARVNVYLYQVTPNAALRNTDLPTRRSDGSLDRRPRTAMDLHYLISFYGREERLEPQQLLGITVAALTAQPILTRAEILKAIQAVETVGAAGGTAEGYLDGSDLADQVEQVRLSPVPLNLEELSKLWSVMFQVPHSLSVAYQGSVVLVDSQVSVQPSLPVGGAGVTGGPFSQPEIEDVGGEGGPRQPVVPGGVMVIRGKRLASDDVRVRIGSVTLDPPAFTADTSVIRLPVTGDWVRAGAFAVQVLHGLGPASNAAGVAVRPVVRSLEARKVTETLDGLRDGEVAAGVDPVVGARQRAALLLNELAPPPGRAARAYAFDASPRADDADTQSLVFPFRGVAPGSYLVRVQVDGADSVLSVDADPASPTLGQYNAPRVAVT